MEATIRELAEDSGLDPPMSQRQVTALLILAGIEPCGRRYTGRPGHPTYLYDADAAIAAHAAEAARTAKQFGDSDWMASALLGRNLIRADTMAGELWWPDGSRAEQMTTGGYGSVRVGHCTVPAHRVIWIAADGPIPPGIQVNHINKLKWDNRRANLELVSFGNNIRHAHAKPYITYHDAVGELAELTELGPERAGINPYHGEFFTGGRVIAGPRSRRPGH